MIISRYKKEVILKAIDAYIIGLVRGADGLSLKRFGIIGDIVEYAILQLLDSVTSSDDNITIIESRKPLTVTQRELDYFLEPEVEQSAQPIPEASISDSKLVDL